MPCFSPRYASGLSGWQLRQAPSRVAVTSSQPYSSGQQPVSSFSQPSSPIQTLRGTFQGPSSLPRKWLLPWPHSGAELLQPGGPPASWVTPQMAGQRQDGRRKGPPGWSLPGVSAPPPLQPMVCLIHRHRGPFFPGLDCPSPADEGLGH